jgi:hypothetical protein
MAKWLIPDDLWTILEITPEQASGVPQITHILKKSKVFGELIDFLRGSADPIAKAYLKRYDSLPARMQKLAPVEAICVAEGIDTTKFFGIIAESVLTQTRFTSQLMAAAAQPSVVEATITSALQADGDKDRKMLHQHDGFLPVPKTQFVNMPGARIDNRVTTENKTIIIPSIESDVKAMSDRFNQRYLGEKLKELPDPVEDAEFEDVEEGE